MVIDTDELIRTLGIKESTLRSDIRELAWLWEESARELSSGHAALEVLRSLAVAYLRGKGMRMGNWQGIERHWEKSHTVQRLVMEEVFQGGFAALPKLGLTSIEQVVAIEREHLERRSIVEQAEEILRQ